MTKTEDLFKTYLKDIYKTSRVKDSTEGSYYPDLKNCLMALAGELGKKVTITPNPKKKESNMPDFSIRDRDGNPIGYIEAKPPEQEDLQTIYDSDQLKRYREDLDNLILTNFLEFWLIRDGKVVVKGQVGGQRLLEARIIPVPTHVEEAIQLLDQFLSFIIPETTSAKELALELAKRTRFLRTQVADELSEGNEVLKGLLEAFKETLIPDLTEDRFADLFAQTISYGLLAARTRTKESFKRKHADEYIPKSIGILREIFKYISSEDLPYPLESAADDIAGVLAKADVKKLFDEYFKEGKGEDPIYHFYETFIKEYDPETRERLGVFYTPAPVVSYITRSINHLLKEKFGKEDGFATTGITVLDPAAGTMTFPAQAIRLAKDEADKHGSGMWQSVAKDHILKDFYAFELLMAPYAIGHIKMSLLLEELGYEIPKDKKFNLYLTNTLDPKEVEESKFPLMRELSEESRDAGRVKREIPIMVIMGNPPYSGHSANVSEKYIIIRKKGQGEIRRKVKTWIGELIEDYKSVAGEPLGEKNPKWLQDDYVKFIRFAQWKIDQSPNGGILGFITNHAYLDNPTFRGMRWSLMQTFDEIYVLNLHGSTLKKEKTPEGGKDENVFDITPGVAIALMIKNPRAKEKKILHTDLWGKRDKKYEWLKANNVKSGDWKEITPVDPDYFFVPKDMRGWNQYQSFWKVTDIFPVNSVGIVTARDNLTIRWTEDDIWQTVQNFSSLEPEMARAAYELGEDAQDWKVELAQKDIKDSGPDKSLVTPVLYRPFDVRYTYYTGNSRGFHCRPRPEVMKHMLRPNLALITMRQVALDLPYTHFLVTDKIAEARAFASAKGVMQVFPLYRYRDLEPQTLFDETVKGHVKSPNFSKEFLDFITTAYGVDYEEVFDYIYAILYSNKYREKYQEFLKTDFPRIPFTKNHKLFQRLAKRGEELVDLHLLRSPELDNPETTFEGSGDGKVEKVEYMTTSRPVVGTLASERSSLPNSTRKIGNVLINEQQYLGPIGPEVWNYYIGGYQVLNKWLKDRKGRELSADEIKTYCKIIAALSKTIEIQKEIDELYPEVERSLI